MQLDVQVATCQAESVPTLAQFQHWADSLAAQLLPDQGANTGCCIRVVDCDEIQALNREFRGKDKATNVLSFPLPVTMEDNLQWLGDILVCAPVVADEAAGQGKAETAHWAHLTIHGLLHLLDYDHENDKDAEEMEQLEVAILAALGFANPYEPEVEASH